ncbi:MAG: hypothetical protein GF331_00295 [Chitinivibrionales bacterium]|nr:hypothetical protein [Chitinivibrionales bacterium]
MPVMRRAERDGAAGVPPSCRSEPTARKDTARRLGSQNCMPYQNRGNIRTRPDSAPVLMDARALPDVRYAWCGRSLLVTDTAGFVDGRGLTGFYYKAMRHLSLLLFTVNGHIPHLCSLAQTDTDSLEFAYVYPPVSGPSTGGSGSGGMHRREGILERGLSLLLRYKLHPSGVDATLRITNHWDEHVEPRVAWQYAADYLSMDEARGRDTAGEPANAARGDHGTVELNSKGATHIGTELRFTGDSRPEIRERGAEGTVGLRRGESSLITFELRAIDCDPLSPVSESSRKERFLERYESSLCRLRSPTEHPFVDYVNHSARLLARAALLDGPVDEWLCPSAGYPLYPFLFGRDSLTAGWMSAMIDQGQLLEHVITRLGRLQGKRCDDYRDEQPGRIVQQARDDIPSRENRTPFGRYYGDVASPFMCVVGLAHLYAWTGRTDQIRAHADCCRRVLQWARDFGDLDGDGFIEYQTRSPNGPLNQAWKDSDNAVVHQDGSQATPPIAACEIQGYYYAALQAAAVFCAILHERAEALHHLRTARKLKQRFNERFWLDDEGYVAFGLDSNKRVIRSRTSNMGHCLATGIVDRRHIPRLVKRLMAPDIYSGWGVRTLSTDNPAYHPLSYHLGTIWPVENASIAFGLRRYGFNREALRVMRGIYELARLWPAGQLPECVGGYERESHPFPHAFPRANVPQTWNSAAFILFTQVLLGIRPLGFAHTLLVDPVLPSWLPELWLEQLRIGDSECTLRFRRASCGRTDVTVESRKGPVHIVRQPPVNSLSAGPFARIGALVGW